MHDGNASLIFTRAQPVRLAPIYDMLPMAYRPQISGQAPGVSATQLEAVHEATAKEARMAMIFWQTLTETPMVSEEFREIAQAHRDMIEARVRLA